MTQAASTSALFPLALAAFVTASAWSQPTLDRPVGEARPYAIDSKDLANPADHASVLFRETVHVPDAAWLRLHFGAIHLAPGSTIRMTSLLDGEVQTFDARLASIWNDASAYFNGDAVQIELLGAPGPGTNRLVLDQVTMEPGMGGGLDGSCGICSGDDRTASDEDFAGRLLPAGCSAAVWNTSSCVLSAGHCAEGSSAGVIEFKVPPSNPDCSLAHPPTADQFPIVQNIHHNGGVGNDWAALRAGENHLGQTPYERFGAYKPVYTSSMQDDDFVEIWGYGVDAPCEANQIQQRSFGTVTNVLATYFTHDADATFGNSGSSLIYDDHIAGIATHCGCPNNTATRVDHAAFTAARRETCPCPADIDGDGTVGFIDLLKVFTNWGAVGEDITADVNDDGVVDILDLLTVLSAWGQC